MAVVFDSLVCVNRALFQQVTGKIRLSYLYVKHVSACTWCGLGNREDPLVPLVVGLMEQVDGGSMCTLSLGYTWEMPCLDMQTSEV